MVCSHVWPLSSHGCRPICWKWTQIKLNCSLLGTNDSGANTSLCFQLSFSVSKLTLLNTLVYLSIYISIYLPTYPSVMGTVGAPHDLASNIRHSSRSSALLMASLSSKPVQSRMFSSHPFLCLPLLFPPCTVPWRTILESPEALVTYPYHFTLRLFTVDKSSL